MYINHTTPIFSTRRISLDISLRGGSETTFWLGFDSLSKAYRLSPNLNNSYVYVSEYSDAISTRIGWSRGSRKIVKILNVDDNNLFYCTIYPNVLGVSDKLPPFLDIDIILKVLSLWLHETLKKIFEAIKCGG